MNHTYKFLGVLVLIISTISTPQGGKFDGIKSPDGEPSHSYLNLNNISTIFKNNGISDIDVYESNSGFVFPKGSGKTAVFISGLLWGAKIAGDPQVRVGGSTYNTGLQGGAILNNGTVEDPDAEQVRIYRVRSDVYPGGPSVDLSVEAIDEGKSEAEVRAQYELDWIEWLADFGAPFEDVDGSGSYNPSVDIPGISGSSQTICFVANDQNPNLTQNFYDTQFPLPVLVDEETLVPNSLELYQNYPNPFNPTTNIRFNIPEEGIVKLEVFDILGQRVAQLLNTELKAGSYEVFFNGNNLASAVYFYMLNVKDKFFEVKKNDFNQIIIKI